MRFRLLAPVTLDMSVSNSKAIARARVDLAPTGALRVGINFGNALLANRDSSGRAPRGTAVDLARGLAMGLGVPSEIVGYSSAGVMAQSVNSGTWDVAFLAVDPARASDIIFSPPYLDIDATYLVTPQWTGLSVADVDRTGLRIAVSAKSAYDLFLTRVLRNATLLRAPTVDASVKLFMNGESDALAGLRPLLLHVAEAMPGSGVLDGRFMVVQQAIGMPKGRPSGARYVRSFIQDAKTSGLIAKAIISNGISGVSIARAS